MLDQRGNVVLSLNRFELFYRTAPLSFDEDSLVIFHFFLFCFFFFFRKARCITHPRCAFRFAAELQFQKFSLGVILRSGQLVREPNKSGKDQRRNARRQMFLLLFIFLFLCNDEKSENWLYLLLVSCFGWLPGDVAQLTFISWNI